MTRPVTIILYDDHGQPVETDEKGKFLGFGIDAEMKPQLNPDTEKATINMTPFSNAIVEMQDGFIKTFPLRCIRFDPDYEPPESPEYDLNAP